MVSDVGMPLHSNDTIDSVASQNQANAVQLEFQKSDDAMKSTRGQDSVIEGELVDTNAGLYPEYLMEEQTHMDKVSSSQVRYRNNKIFYCFNFLIFSFMLSKLMLIRFTSHLVEKSFEILPKLLKLYLKVDGKTKKN